jgi:hypothetical protein
MLDTVDANDVLLSLTACGPSKEHSFVAFNVIVNVSHVLRALFLG